MNDTEVEMIMIKELLKTGKLTSGSVQSLRSSSYNGIASLALVMVSNVKIEARRGVK